MANRIGEVRAQSQAKQITLLKKHATIEVLSVDDADTITVDSMATIENVKVVSLVDSSDVVVTFAANVITIDDVAVSASHLLVTVVGV